MCDSWKWIVLTDPLCRLPVARHHCPSPLALWHLCPVALHCQWVLVLWDLWSWRLWTVWLPIVPFWTVAARYWMMPCSQLSQM
eukprot:5166966-Amphidinium_carterae.1